MSPGSLSEASSIVFLAFTFALLGFLHLWHIWFCHAVCFTYLYYSGFMFVLSSTFFAAVCVLGGEPDASYFVRPCFDG